MYPLIFEPIYKEMIWGGEKLGKFFNRKIPTRKTGESWDISCREKEMSVVLNGELKGKTISDIIKSNPKFYLGTEIDENAEFPLLVKIIDAKENLSVQVHPDDTYAREKENYVFGKNEMWYILDAPKNGNLIIGLKEVVSKSDFKKAVRDGTSEECLNLLPVKAGDMINIPSGLVHAITAGVVLAEIQQNSDITYRIYDYNRPGPDGKPRELHVDKSMDVIDFDGKLKKSVVIGIKVKKNGGFSTYCIANKYFAIEKYETDGEMHEIQDGSKFCIFTVVSGSVEIIAENGTVNLGLSQSAFVPAGISRFKLSGKAILLKSYVPNIEKDFIKPLENHGFSLEEIYSNVEINV